MKHEIIVGIDFHKINTQICIMSLEGEILEEKRISSESCYLERFFANKPKALIGVEISGGVFQLAGLLKKLGHQVKILKPSAGIPFRRTGQKSDREDALAIAKALKAGVCQEVALKEPAVRVLRSMLSEREMIIKERIMLVNHVRGILREYGLTLPKGKAAFFSRIHFVVSQLESPLLQDQLIKTVRRIQGLITEEEEVTMRIKQEWGKDDRVKRLQSIPGFGFITSICYLSTVGSLDRFADSQQVSAYLGLTPRQFSSGQKKRFGGITKAGCALTRRNLIHGARSALRIADIEIHPILKWAHQLREGQAPKNIKIVALAAKLARVAYTILRDGTIYEATPLLEKVA